MEFSIQYRSINTIGDGSCLIHAILQAYNKTYNNYTKKTDKMRMVKNVRKLISEHIKNTNIYDELSRGELNEISEFIPEVKKQNMISYMRSNNWLNYYYFELLTKIFNMNIIVVSNGYIYNFGDNELLYDINKKSIFINYIEQAHFETIEVLTKKGYQRFFDKNLKMIKKYII